MTPTDRHQPPPPDGLPERRKGPRPGGHGSYKIGGEPATGHRWHDAPAPPPAPSARYVPPPDVRQGARHDDGVPHRAHGAGDDDPTHNEDVAHEHSDINIRAVVASAVIMAVVTAIAHVSMWLLFGVLERQAAANDEPVPLARPASQMPGNTAATPAFTPDTVGGPQLLTNEPLALEKHRETERTRLHGFGWVNQGAGVAHMPIEQAKKLVVERGLPVREGEAPASSLGTHLPARGESSGGRAISTTLPEAPPATQVTAPEGAHGQQTPATAEPGHSPQPSQQPGTAPKGPGGH